MVISSSPLPDSCTLAGLSDEDLVRAAQQSGPHAQLAKEALIARMAPLCKALAWKHRVSPGNWEDAMQSAAVGILIALSRFDPARPAKFSTFAYHHIDREIANCLREIVAFDEQTDLDVSRTAAPSPIDELADELFMLRDFVDALSPDQQGFLQLRFGLGFTQSEIARQRNMSRQAVSKSEKKLLETARLWFDS